MTIDLLLTHAKAMESIGPFLYVNERKKKGFPYSRNAKPGFRPDIEDNYTLEFDPENYRFKWVFNRDSKLAIVLRQRAEERLQHQDAEPESWHGQTALSNAVATTEFYSVSAHYNGQMMELGHIGVLEEEEESFGHTAFCVIEGLLNGIEHGSDFCHLGEVVLSFYGGERGALYTVQSPKPFDFAGYVARNKSTFVKSLPNGNYRGFGFHRYSEVQIALVNGEDTESGFRLIAMYPVRIPTAPQR